MKKISFFRVVPLAFLIAGSAVAFSQANTEVAALGISGKPEAHGRLAWVVAVPTEKALGIFNKMFSNARNVSWKTDRKGLLTVYFETEGKIQRAGFDKKGNLDYTISYYREEQLPKPILLKVKQTYFGKSIFCVTELTYLGVTAYLIILEDKTSWLHIKIIGDEMVEEKVFLKA